MALSNPYIHIGSGRTPPCAPSSANTDVVRVGSGTIKEGSKLTFSVSVRNAGSQDAIGCVAELWFSPGDITGTSGERICRGHVFYPPTPQVDARKNPPFDPIDTVRSTTFVWDVPASLGIPADEKRTYKIIAKATCPAQNSVASQGPAEGTNPDPTRECDPRCGVRAITIVGV